MKAALATAFLLLCVLAVAAPPEAHAQALREYTAPLEGTQPAEQPQAEPAEGGERVKEEITRRREEAEAKIHGFAVYASEMLQGLADLGFWGWVIFGLVAGVSLIALLWGWTLVQSLLIPFAPVWGLMTGGMTAFFLIKTLYTDRPDWFRITIFAVGVCLGFGLYLFAALRAKPIAAFLVVLSPFIIIAALLLGLRGPTAEVLALVIFLGGFAAGFAAMIEVRPLAITSTAVLGGCGLLAGWGLLGYLAEPRAQVLRDSFHWLVDNPLMLVLAVVVLTFMGANFQFTTGPRGSLED